MWGNCMLKIKELMPYVQIGYKYKQLASKYDFFIDYVDEKLCTLSLFLAHHIRYRVDTEDM